MNESAPIKALPGDASALVVKFLWRGSIKSDTGLWRRQLSHQGETALDGCRFVFDADARDYDWLVVCDDLPVGRHQRFSTSVEPLACAPANTLLITSEPSSVNIYERAFLAQFGHVLSSQEPWAVRHRSHIYTHSVLRWFYGAGRNAQRTFDDIAANAPLAKTRLISTVCSAKRQRHTLHNRRFAFTAELSKRIPELEIFGHGVRPIDDKAEALDSFRYHVAIENHIAPHHWTEKLSDAFLGCTLPFYVGAPNAADYFPADSFIPIDITDVDAAARIIRQAIDANLYEQRLPAILEARRRVLEVHGLFPLVARHIRRLNVAGGAVPGAQIRSRRMTRLYAPLSALADVPVRLRARYFKPRLLPAAASGSKRATEP